MSDDNICNNFKPTDNMKDLSLGYSENSSFVIIIIPAITIIFNLMYIFTYCGENKAKKNSR